jgi:hypothetical protein
MHAPTGCQLPSPIVGCLAGDMRCPKGIGRPHLASFQPMVDKQLTRLLKPICSTGPPCQLPGPLPRVAPNASSAASFGQGQLPSPHSLTLSEPHQTPGGKQQKSLGRNWGARVWASLQVPEHTLLSPRTSLTKHNSKTKLLYIPRQPLGALNS